jgi:hypothetical protein
VTITAVPFPTSTLTAVPVSMPLSLNGVVALPVSSGGGAGYMHTQSSPSAQWHITFPDLGRLPSVQIYLTTGEFIITDVLSTSTSVTVTFPSATAGYAVIT